MTVIYNLLYLHSISILSVINAIVYDSAHNSRTTLLLNVQLCDVYLLKQKLVTYVVYRASTAEWLPALEAFPF